MPALPFARRLSPPRCLSKLSVLPLFCLLGACGAFSGTSTSGLSSSQYRYDPNKVYHARGIAFEAQRDFLDRYACEEGNAVFCECAGQLSRSCRCRC